MDDPKMEETLPDDAKTEELLTTADANITRINSKLNVLNNSKSDLVPPSDDSEEVAPPVKNLERADTTVGETECLENGDGKALASPEPKRKEHASEYSEEMSITSVSLHSHGAQTIESTETLQSRDATSKGEDMISAASKSPKRDGKTRTIDAAGVISSPIRDPKRGVVRGTMREPTDTKSSDDNLTTSGHSHDDYTGHSRSSTSGHVRGVYRQRRGSAAAYKVPYANKPKTGGGFVTVKRRYQQKRSSGIVLPPRRYEVPSGDDDDDSSSLDAFPPPALDMTQSMHLAVSELKEQKDREEAERKQNQVEPKGWLYMTALFTLVCSTGGVLFIVLYAFGAAFGDAYTEARAQLEHLSSPGSMDDPSTPQHAALKWVVDRDRADRMDLVKDVARREARYGLAVLYYSTEGEFRWANQLNFLSDEHECDWNVEMGTAGGGEKSSTRVGVICDEDGTVVELSIVGNNLRGQLPSELSALSSLIALNLMDNELTGTIPDWKWDGLESLHLQHNAFEGSIPVSIWTELPDLRILDLSSNQFSSSLPNAIRKLSNIETMNLGYNELTGSITLSPNELMDQDDDAKGDLRTLIMPSLRTFNVTNNEMRGTLDFVELFPSLQVLDVTKNRFTGRLPGVLGGLTRLEALHLSDNQFFGAIPTAIGTLANLTSIVASHNELKSEFPWGSFDADNRLTEIILSANSLSGTLPENLGMFSSLEVVDFGRNLLSGSIPPSIASDIRLRILRLSRNQLDGPLPAQPTAFPESLEIIDLHSNQFVGRLPADWANLSSLNVLTLHDNDFEGPIPPEWSQMSSLERITLHLNRLEGSVDFMCDLKPQPVITANCAGNQPLVECSCCTLCLE